MAVVKNKDARKHCQGKEREEEEERDVFREMPFRYLGYANEVGEAFRRLVPLRVVHLSYLVSSTYVIAHAAARGWRARSRGAIAELQPGGKNIQYSPATLPPPHPSHHHPPPPHPSHCHPPPAHPTMEFLDTLIWQGLASVVIPGFTINRICAVSSLLLPYLTRSALTRGARKWVITAIGLGSIPLIIHPIDSGVDWCSDEVIRPRLRAMFMS